MQSLPSRGAWIEIMVASAIFSPIKVAPLAGSVDRNFSWRRTLTLPSAVAPLAGSVDRNALVEVVDPYIQHVAPLAGSVDRNPSLPPGDTQISWVAPLAGSVDRNILHKRKLIPIDPSLPSRGAWIEIFPQQSVCRRLPRSLPSRGAWIEILRLNSSREQSWVAPLAGSVDRNLLVRGDFRGCLASLPSRGAWIEIEESSG